MAGDTTVSFKVYLSDENVNSEKQEIRRFGIDRDVVCNFTYLQQKLQAVFPSLQGKTFVVSWADADGDKVSISSDEELIIALTEIQGEVKKLIVTVKNNTGCPASQFTNGTWHPGVSCDGCQSWIKGYRYKCAICENYDLCGACEIKHIHPEHAMIRIATPDKDVGKLWTMMNVLLGPEERMGGHHFRGKRHEHGKKKRKCDRYESETGEESNDNMHDDKQRCKRSKHRPNRHSKMFDILNWPFVDYSTPLYPTPSTSRSECQDEPSHVKYLRTIGKTVANLLDPLGIDVDVEIRSKDRKTGENNPTENKKETKDTTSKQSEEKVEKEVRFNINVEATSSQKDDSDSVKEITESFAAQKVSESSDKDDWTIVNEIIKESSPPASSTGAIPRMDAKSKAQLAAVLANVQAAAMANSKLDAQAKQLQKVRESSHAAFAAAKTSASANHLPLSTERPAFASNGASAPEQRSLYPNLMVDQALQQMLSMGFTNEGNWLYQLLEAKNGDISKVMDALHPTK